MIGVEGNCATGRDAGSAQGIGGFKNAVTAAGAGFGRAAVFFALALGISGKTYSDEAEELRLSGLSSATRSVVFASAGGASQQIYRVGARVGGGGWIVEHVSDDNAFLALPVSAKLPRGMSVVLMIGDSLPEVDDVVSEESVRYVVEGMTAEIPAEPGSSLQDTDEREKH